MIYNYRPQKIVYSTIVKICCDCIGVSTQAIPFSGCKHFFTIILESYKPHKPQSFAWCTPSEKWSFHHTKPVYLWHYESSATAVNVIWVEVYIDRGANLKAQHTIMNPKIGLIAETPVKSTNSYYLLLFSALLRWCTDYITYLSCSKSDRAWIFIKLFWNPLPSSSWSKIANRKKLFEDLHRLQQRS